MDWSEVSARVVVEACSAHPEDKVLLLGLGTGAIARALAPAVSRVVVVDPAPADVGPLPDNVEVRRGDLRAPPKIEGLSVVCLHDTLRSLPPDQQRALVRRLGELLPPRALLVIGDVMWSLPPAMIDEPEQFGANLEHVQETRTIERWVREAGFLPDLHRFGPAIAVMIALRTGE